MHWLFLNYHSFNHHQESYQEDLISTNYKFINYILHSVLLILLKTPLSLNEVPGEFPPLGNNTDTFTSYRQLERQQETLNSSSPLENKHKLEQKLLIKDLCLEIHLW